MSVFRGILTYIGIFEQKINKIYNRLFYERLPVDEPALASIMTYDHAKDLCASEIGPLMI